MILKIYSIYDSKADAYQLPFFHQSTGSAKRSFQDLVNDGESAFARHPEDYTLFELGTWEDSKADFDMYAAPKSLGVAIDYLLVEKKS